MARSQDEDGPGLNAADTWISPTHNYFCMAIPKSACSKTKLVLQQLEGLPVPPDPLQIHFRNTPGFSFVPSIADFDTSDAAAILTSPEWFRFAFVRNPYSRLFYAYKSQVMDLSSPYVSFRESIRQHAGYPSQPDSGPSSALGMVGFADFVRYIAEQDDDHRDGHWKSQSATMCLDLIRYDFVGQVETFVEDFTSLLRRFDAPTELVASLSERVNTTIKLPLAAAYNKDLADLVHGIYVHDFETFGYDRDSWMFID